ncbi:MAG: type II toxin-antitoxin system PemK/MazF family toxin [Micropepsaceae bacterium]
MPLPTPHPGLVISYSYLWRREAESGLSEGGKDRPAVIVLATRTVDGNLVVTVAPITHSEPTKRTPSIEIPAKIKEHLGLDTSRSWVILNETNEFHWPGYDLRPVPRRPGQFAYGVLPQNLFAKISRGVAELRDKGDKPVSR